MTTLIDRILSQIIPAFVDYNLRTKKHIIEYGDTPETFQLAEDRLNIEKQLEYNLRQILEAELTAVNGVDELIEKMKEIFISFHGTQAEERGAERMYNYIMSEIKSLKQTPVASQPNKTIREWRIIDGKQVILEREIDQPTQERLKDYKPKEVEIKKIKNVYQDCPNCEQDNCLILNDMNYCPGCGSKIKWIA